ncbi:polysaccharide deacetylase family protein, partial [Streptomyces calidiresistens]|uniref:polysaccharide deacetylase family protein n=1 Tax=Streptomyces calidiresistens TaxID=1485586 RepID=UPI003F68ECBC
SFPARDPDRAAGPGAGPAAVPPAPRRSTAPLRVLMYHSVAPLASPGDDPYLVTVTPARLDRQLGLLRRCGLRGVSVGELLAAHAAGRSAGLVGLSFDDGYADFAEHALPLLRRHGCTASLYVLPGLLGADNVWDVRGPRKPLLDAEGVRACAGAGVEIGSHGLFHRALPDLDEEEMARELRESRERVRAITGVAPAGFCYPYGAVGPREIAAVRAAGYHHACAIDPGPLTGRYALPRVHVGERDGAPRLALKALLHPIRRRPVPRAETVDAGRPA